MQSRAVIETISHSTMTVVTTTQQHSACTHCNSCTQQNPARYTIPLPTGDWTVGQEILIEIKPAIYVLTSVLVFLAPITISAIITGILTALLPHVSEWMYGACFLGGIAAGFCIIILISRCKRYQQYLQPHITSAAVAK